MFRDAAKIAAPALLALMLAGCTARPMLEASTPAAMAGDAASAMSMQSTLSSVSVAPATTREGQQVRNRLIFLFGQGAGEPRDPAYRMALDVSTAVSGVSVQPAPGFVDTGQPSAGVVELTGRFSITDSAGAAIASGVRRATAAYDRPGQGFAERSARIDAEDRAARELAEMLHLAVAQGFAAR